MRIEVATKYFPSLTKWHVRRALKRIKPVDSAGIEFIRLMDENLDDKLVNKQPAYLRGDVCMASYVYQHKRAIHIELYTRSLYTGIPSYLRATPMITLRVAFALAHEVGHHLVAHRGYIYETTEKYQPLGSHDEYHEGMVDNYARDVVKKMSKNWYYKLGQSLAKILSSLLFQFGLLEWNKRDFKEAARYWFYAYLADPDNLDAERSYLKVKAMINSDKWGDWVDVSTKGQ